MSLSELLALIGLAWPRLLLYPGGLAAFALVWLLAGRRLPARWPNLALALSAIVPAWLGVALLPLPAAARFERPIDALLAFGLLSWPLLLSALVDVHAERARGAQRLAGILNGAPPAILALLLLALLAGSFRVDLLSTTPGTHATPQQAGLHWFAALAFTLALPALLGLRPIVTSAANDDPGLRTGRLLAGIGMTAFATLFWLAPLADRVWLMPLPPLLIGLLLWAFNRYAPGPARRWALLYFGLDCILALGILAATMT